MTTKLARRVVLACMLVGAVTVTGLANVGPANAGSTKVNLAASTAAVVRQLTTRLPTVQGVTQTHVGTTPLVQIKTVGSNVGTTPPANTPISFAPINPSAGKQPGLLAATDPVPSQDRGVRGGGSTETAVLPRSAPTGGSQDFLVTATVAQSSDLSTGTFTFDTGDGTQPSISAAPLAPPTAREAGLDGVVAPNASGKSSITATVAGAVTAPDGSRHMAIDLYGDKLLSFAVDLKSGGKIVTTSGNALASSGKTPVIALGEPVTMLASVARDIVRSTINLTGIRQANGYLMRDGRLVLVFVDNNR